MYWNMVIAIATAFMALVILITAIFAIFQLREVVMSRKVSAFISVCQYLQKEDARKARDILIKVLGKDFKDWSKEEIEAAEKSCSTYDIAGIMVSKKLIEKDLILDEWRNSIIKCWEAAKPMIIEYRKDRGEDFWDDFEKLYEMAIKIEMEYNTV